MQRLLGIDAAEASDLDGGKKHVAQLFFKIRLLLHRGAQFLHFFVELVQRAADSGKFKAGFGSLALQLVRTPERREGTGDGIHRVSRGLLPFLFALELLPVDEDLFACFGRFGAEDVRMAEDQLAADVIGHIVKGEASGVLLHVDVEENLHQNVAQLLAHQLRVVAVKCFGSLVRLLKKVAAIRQMRLHAIPGAAVRCAENAQDRDQIVKIINGFLLKMYHILSCYARVFASFAGILANF